MSAVDALNAGAVMLIKSRGVSSTYTQAEVGNTVTILIESDLEIVDPDSGLSVYVSAAIFCKDGFPFAKPLTNDTILQDGRTWTLKRNLEDDGYLVTYEIV